MSVEVPAANAESNNPAPASSTTAAPANRPRPEGERKPSDPSSSSSKTYTSSSRSPSKSNATSTSARYARVAACIARTRCVTSNSSGDASEGFPAASESASEVETKVTRGSSSSSSSSFSSTFSFSSPRDKNVACSLASASASRGFASVASLRPYESTSCHRPSAHSANSNTLYPGPVWRGETLPALAARRSAASCAPAAIHAATSSAPRRGAAERPLVAAFGLDDVRPRPRATPSSPRSAAPRRLSRRPSGRSGRVGPPPGTRARRRRARNGPKARERRSDVRCSRRRANANASSTRQLALAPPRRSRRRPAPPPPRCPPRRRNLCRASARRRRTPPPRAWRGFEPGTPEARRRGLPRRCAATGTRSAWGWSRSRRTLPERGGTACESR